jgi:hypothetical protein
MIDYELNVVLAATPINDRSTVGTGGMGMPSRTVVMGIFAMRMSIV